MGVGKKKKYNDNRRFFQYDFSFIYEGKDNNLRYISRVVTKRTTKSVVLFVISISLIYYIQFSMSTVDISVSDRISGSLFGLLVCDSLGTAVESQPPGSFEPVTTLRGGGKYRLKPGQFTDDGSMALCLAIALLGSDINIPGIRPSAIQMLLYRRWYESGYLSPTGECFDIGITGRTALYKFIADYDRTEGNKFLNTDAYYGSTNSSASGNGSLMRLAPVPLLYHRDLHTAMNETVNSSKTTHGSQLCIDSCRIYTTLIIGALQGATKEELLSSEKLYVPAGLPTDYWTAETTVPLDPAVTAVMSGSYKNQNPPEIKASGFVIKTLEAALWAFYHTNSFEEGACKAVNLGDDADTVGAIYGELAGAYYGINAIPNEWKEKCSFQSLVQTIVDEIFMQSQQLTVTEENRAVSFNKPSIVYRRVLQVYNELAAFYSGTIKRRVLPCPKQYKSSEQFDEDVTQFRSIYDNILKSEEWKETTTDDEKQLILNRSDLILKEFLNLIEDDKNSLNLKWARDSNRVQVRLPLPTGNSS